MDTNINTMDITTMGNKMKTSAIIILLISLFISSCELVENGKTKEIVVSNYMMGDKYLIVENEDFASPEMLKYAYNLLLSKVNNRYKNPLNKKLLEDLGKSISVKNIERNQYFVLYRNSRIYDLIKLTKATKEITLKDVNTIKDDSGTLKSDVYNVIENSFFHADEGGISNASIILKDDIDAFRLKNFKMNNSLFSFRTATSSGGITFDNVTIKSSHLLDLKNKINLKNTIKIDDSHIQGLKGENALFEATTSNCRLMMNNSFISSMPSFIEGGASLKMEINNCIFTNFTNDMKNYLVDSKGSAIHIKNSYFNNVELISTGKKGRLELTNNFFHNYQEIISSLDQECFVRNNLFVSDRKDNSLVKHDVVSYSDSQTYSKNTYMINNVIEMKNNYKIQFDIKAANLSNIEIDSLLININNSDFNDIVHDDNDLRTTETYKGKTGKVKFSNLGKIDLSKIRYSGK